MEQTSQVDSGRPDARLHALRRSGLLEGSGRHHLDRLTHLARTLTGAPVSLISMVEEDHQWFTSQQGLGEPWASARRTPLSHSVCQSVVDRQAPLVIPDMGDQPEFEDHPARADLSVEAYCGVPIRDPDGHVLGSFCVIDDTAHGWDESTIAVLEHLAATVTETVAANHEYAEMVADLQQRLLPEVLPQPAAGTLDARYRQVPYSLAIGGDFYDAHVRPDGEVDVVVCDVIGHGVRSTQAAAQLRAVARAALLGRVDTPADAINRIAQSAVGLPGCDGAALLIARISADGRSATWARAGALPPVIIGPHARVLEGGASPPVGVGPCVQDPDCRVELAVGQALLLFTDGLVERRGEHLDDGYERLLDLAGPTQPLDDLIERVCPSPLQFDDVAVVRWHRGG